MSLPKLKVACLLVLLRADECAAEQPARAELEDRLKRQHLLNWLWLGSQVHRQNLTIQIKTKLTPHACWPLPSGWHALLIYPVEALSAITPLY